jgi:hypothetical protein
MAFPFLHHSDPVIGRCRDSRSNKSSPVHPLRRWLMRAAGWAILCAALIQGGAPVADGLLFHLGGADQALGPHFDRLGGCGAHAEHCAVTPAAGREHLGLGAITPRSKASLLSTTIECLAASVEVSPPHTTNRSRAPPSITV